MQQHVLTITQVKIEENELLLTPIEEWPKDEWLKLKDGERMLADSDALALVYILELDGQFVQLRFPKHTWPQLHEGYQKGLPAVLEGPENITLEKFKEELEYLLDNIEGNGNYGEDMVAAFENAFQLNK
ncbi:hypothetical protein [Bacillus sp. FJAT-44742]|uniref:UPF0738 family protein n=1 Tax=Bacillus sp. FJAT-44742 TaxID=2014005 RepID=UPI000C242B85|nr:hypothetical protein [Bacillus sp. FJAT-44742]